MRVSYALTALVGLCATAQALSAIDDGSPQEPATPGEQDGFSVQLVEGGHLPSGPVAMKRLYKKYRKPVPANVLRAAAAATQSGSVQATPYPDAYDRAYIAPVKIGKQTLRLDFDSGSSDLWTFSNLLPSSQCAGHVCYNLGGTPINNEFWDISYGDGSSSSGVVYADKVQVGPVTATVQAVEAATSVSSQFLNQQNFDGLLGLGFDAGNTCYPAQCYTFMHQVGKTLPKNLFTSTLRKGKAGTYDFGFIDKKKYSGTIAYARVDHTTSGNPSYWEFRSPGYAIGAGAKQAHSMAAIADTGTSLALVDQVIVNAYYQNVVGAHYDSGVGAVIFPCTSATPKLSIYIGAQKRTMPGSYGNYAPLGDGNCFGGIQSNNGMGFNILGDIFLKSQFVVYDITNNRVGFAQQKGVAV